MDEVNGHVISVDMVTRAKQAARPEDKCFKLTDNIKEFFTILRRDSDHLCNTEKVLSFKFSLCVALLEDYNNHQGDIKTLEDAEKWLRSKVTGERHPLHATYSVLTQKQSDDETALQYIQRVQTIFNQSIQDPMKFFVEVIALGLKKSTLTKLPNAYSPKSIEDLTIFATNAEQTAQKSVPILGEEKLSANWVNLNVPPPAIYPIHNAGYSLTPNRDMHYPQNEVSMQQSVPPWPYVDQNNQRANYGKHPNKASRARSDHRYSQNRAPYSPNGGHERLRCNNCNHLGHVEYDCRRNAPNLPKN